MKYYEAGDYQKALDHFLLAQIPDEEAGSARSGNRDIQVNYFIGLAYEALNNKSKAKSYFKSSANTDSDLTGYMQYYKGLSLNKLGDKARASEIFNSLIAEGEKQLTGGGAEDDFFAIFGEREAENMRMSQAYTLKGLGYKGSGKADPARENLTKAVDLSVGNLWAGVELKGL
jgi:tetratricopeptide (TPR) repeat protein